MDGGTSKSAGWLRYPLHTNGVFWAAVLSGAAMILQLELSVAAHWSALPWQSRFNALMLGVLPASLIWSYCLRHRRLRRAMLESPASATAELLNFARDLHLLVLAGCALMLLYKDLAVDLARMR